MVWDRATIPAADPSRNDFVCPLVILSGYQNLPRFARFLSSRMELRHLRYFVAVAEDLNFRRAAERLHVAQPPLSRQIRDLEEEIGHPLFDRDRGGVRLTDAGRLFYRGARRTLEEAAGAIESAREAARGRLGELNVGNIGALSIAVVPASLAAFRRTHPQVEVNLLELGRDQMIEDLAEGRLDLALVSETAALRPGMECECVLENSVMIVMAASHPLARASAKRPLDPMKLAAESLLYIHPKHALGYLDWIRNLCRQIGFTPRLGRATDSREGLIGLVTAGYGVAFAPAMLATGQQIRGLVARKLAGDVPPFRLLAVWMAKGKSSYVESFVAALRVAGRATQPAGKAQRRPKK